MESLNYLANTNCFSILQEKLNEWKYDYKHNCTEANISKCCELIELNARIQSQLFKLLGFCGLYGGLDSSEKKLKNLLIPYLGKDYFENGLTSTTVLDILNDVSKQTKTYPLNSVSSNNSSPQRNNCSKDRCIKQGIYDRLDELENTILDLSNESKMSPKKQVKKKKRNSTRRSNSLSRIPDNIAEMDNMDSYVQSDPPGDFSGSDIEEIRNDTYLQCLVGRYNDLFSESRINAMEHLRKYSDNHENNQRLLFALIMTTAKFVIILQRSYRNGYGMETIAKQMQIFRDKIPRSALKNLRAQIIYELLNYHGTYFRFHLNQDFSFSEIESLINNTIQLFWNFGGAKNGLKLLEAADGELFDEHKYRRSYDSDFTAPLVNHHIWPCLIQNQRVLVKGEACTRSSNKMILNRNIGSIIHSSSSRCSSK